MDSSHIGYHIMISPYLYMVYKIAVSTERHTPQPPPHDVNIDFKILQISQVKKGDHNLIVFLSATQCKGINKVIISKFF